jgi:hypothetical protein
MIKKKSTKDIRRKTWLAIRKKAGLKIDPETAEVAWEWAQTLDPYGIHDELLESDDQIGREYFARSPGSDIWVWFGDLPAATADALWKKHKEGSVYPAGVGEILGDGPSTVELRLMKKPSKQLSPWQAAKILLDLAVGVNPLSGEPTTAEGPTNDPLVKGALAKHGHLLFPS